MTKLEKLLLSITAVFFVLALALLPRGGSAGRLAEPPWTEPGPPADTTSVEDTLVVTLRQDIDINRADARTLTALPGVGPALAEAIVAYRTEHGPFSTLTELLLVDGFGAATLEGIRQAAEP